MNTTRVIALECCDLSQPFEQATCRRLIPNAPDFTARAELRSVSRQSSNAPLNAAQLGRRVAQAGKAATGRSTPGTAPLSDGLGCCGVGLLLDTPADRRDACPTTSNNSRAAFSLIEVMVAILILGVALVGLTHGITTALGSSKESELQTTAMLFAQGKIEELRATTLIVGEDDGECGTGLELYRWIQNVTTTDLDGLHDVKVVVENVRTGQEICELQTLIFEVPVSRETAKETNSKREKKEGGR